MISNIQWLTFTRLRHPLSELYLSDEGWVSIMHPRHNENIASDSARTLFKLPEDLAVHKSLACGTKIALATVSGRLLIVDCGPMLSHLGLAS